MATSGSGMDVVSESQFPIPREDSQTLMSQNTQVHETGSQLETMCTRSSLVGSSVHTAECQHKVSSEEDNCPDEQNMMSLPDMAKVTSTQFSHNPSLHGSIQGATREKKICLQPLIMLSNW